MSWDCSFTPLLEINGISECPFRLSLRDATDPLLKTHRLVLSAAANQDLSSFYDEWSRDPGPWHNYMRRWPAQLRVEAGYKEDYHPASRAVAEIAREHWLWHLWQYGLAPIDRSPDHHWLYQTPLVKLSDVPAQDRILYMKQLRKEATFVRKSCVPGATGPVFLADSLPPTFFTSPAQ